MPTRRELKGRCVLLLILAAIIGNDARAELRIVALTGQPAPGTLGFTIASLGIPALNAAGNTAFQGTNNAISTINNYVWSEGNGAGVEHIAHEGGIAPGGPFGMTFGDMSTRGEPNLSDGGQISFVSPLSGTGVTTANDLGVFRGSTSASLQLVAREGSPAPGLPSGVNFSIFASPKINSTGRLVFTTSLIGSGITTANDSSLWTDSTGSLALVAQEGSPATGISAGVNFAAFSSPAINDNGRIAFFGNLTGTGVTTANDEGLWRSTTGTNLELVVREGDQAPGIPTGNNFSLLGSPVFNNAGHVAFAGRVVGPDITSENQYGIWSTRSGQLSLDYRSGEPAPQLGEGAAFGMLAVPAMNHDNRMAFLAAVTGPTTLTAIFNEGRTGSLELVAATTQSAPGTPTGVTFSSFTGTQSYHIRPGMNASGQVAFFGKVTGSVITTANDFGIWATDLAGELHLVAREGDTIDVDPGAGTDLRTINVLSFYTGTGNEDGNHSGLNDSGLIAFSATFVGGGGGVFVSDLVSGLPGDYNANGTVDAADYVVWRKGLDTTYTQDDYTVWRSNFGKPAANGAAVINSSSVPEPATLIVLVVGMLAICSRRLVISV
jgi:hypothetical protein